MYVFKSLRKLVYRHFKNMKLPAVLAMLLLYGLSSWFLLYIAEEEALIGADFIYWLIVTASTVGLMLSVFFVVSHFFRYSFSRSLYI